MTKISKSPERNTFQKESYIKRKEEAGEPISEAYLSMWDSMQKDTAKREADAAWQKDNLEWDLRTTEWMLEKVRSSDSYAQNLYAALCNQEFIKQEMWPLLKDQRWSCTWRYAGGIVADMLEKGDYIDWYCSGMGGLAGGWDQDAETFAEWSNRTKYVSEGYVTDEIRSDLKKLGWLTLDGNDEAE